MRLLLSVRSCVIGLAVASLAFSASLKALHAQAPDKPKEFVKFLTTEKNQVVAGLLGRENDTHIEVIRLEADQPVVFKKQDIRQLRKGISEDELILAVGLPAYLAWKITQSVPTNVGPGQIVKVDTTAIYCSLGLAKGVKEGHELRVYRGTTELVDPATGKVLGTERRLVARLKVFESRDNYSKARLDTDLEITLQPGDIVEPSNGNSAIVVFPLVDVDGRETAFGVEFAESLTTSLVKRKVQVVERELLGKVIAELGLQQSDLFDAAFAQRVGKQVGGSAALLGTISNSGSSTDVKLRLVEIETGRILFAATHRIFGQAKKDATVIASASGAPEASLSGFIASWSFEGTSRAKSKHKLDSREGELRFAAGVRGKALVTENSGGVTIPHSKELDIWKDDLTLLCWINVESIDGEGIIFSKGEYGKPGWIVDFSANRRKGIIRVETWREGASVNQEIVTAERAIESGKWHHLCLTSKKSNGGREIKIYIDGRERASGRVDAGNLDIASRDLQIGRFVGAMDEVIIRRGVLSPDDVSAAARR